MKTIKENKHLKIDKKITVSEIIKLLEKVDPSTVFMIDDGDGFLIDNIHYFEVDYELNMCYFG